MIQEHLNCLETTDYFFTNIEPKLIIVERPPAHHSTSTSHQPLNRDKVSQQTHPQQPEETYQSQNPLTTGGSCSSVRNFSVSKADYMKITNLPEQLLIKVYSLLSDCSNYQ